jgi:type II secretory pathway component GspD/PulD (secretin)
MKSLISIIGMILFLNTSAFCQGCTPELKIFKVEHGDAGPLVEVANSLKSDNGKVSFDPNSSSLIVFDCPENLERIAGVIKTLDVREKQVQIDVLVVEASRKVLEDAGITARQVIIPQGEFEAIAKLIKENKESNTRTSMMVRTMSNRPALLQVTKDEIIGAESVIFSDGTAITTAVREPIGSQLEVLPVANNDGTIKVILRPSVSSMERPFTPSERSIITQVVINDGDTVAIGGAEVDKESSRSGTPLYKRASGEKKKVEMFLTAKIVE